MAWTAVVADKKLEYSGCAEQEEEIADWAFTALHARSNRSRCAVSFLVPLKIWKFYLLSAESIVETLERISYIPSTNYT